MNISVIRAHKYIYIIYIYIESPPPSKTRLSVARDLIWPRHISAFMPRQQPKFKLKYFVTLTCSHGGVKVKMKCMLHIYIVPSVDWYHHWRNRLSSFGGEANTNYYPLSKVICDERTEGRKDGRTDRRTR